MPLVTINTFDVLDNVHIMYVCVCHLKWIYIAIQYHTHAETDSKRVKTNETNIEILFRLKWDHIDKRHRCLNGAHNWKCHKNCSKLNFCLQNSAKFVFKRVLSVWAKKKNAHTHTSKWDGFEWDRKRMNTNRIKDMTTFPLN